MPEAKPLIQSLLDHGIRVDAAVVDAVVRLAGER